MSQSSSILALQIWISDPRGPPKGRKVLAGGSHQPLPTMNTEELRKSRTWGAGGWRWESRQQLPLQHACSSKLPLPTMIKELNLRIKTNQPTNQPNKKTTGCWDVYERNDFSKLKHLNLPIHWRVLNPLTWDIWFSLISSNLWCWNYLPLFVAYFYITGLHAPPPQSCFLRATWDAASWAWSPKNSHWIK